MKICILGPSHLAALRDAETQGLVDTSAHDITYCGHLSKHYRHITARDGRVIFDTPEPVEPLADDLLVTVDLADFDLIFCHTTVINYGKIMDRTGSSPAMLKRYSAQMAEKALARAICDARIFRIANEVRAQFAGPVLVSSCPMSAAPPATQEPDPPADDPDAVQLEPLVTRTLQSAGFGFVPQPADTIIDGRYTARRYSVGSVKLGVDKEHGKLDILHMNAKYGARVLEDMLSRIDLCSAENPNSAACQ